MSERRRLHLEGVANAGLRTILILLNALVAAWLFRSMGPRGYGAFSSLLAASQYLLVLDIGMSALLVEEYLREAQGVAARGTFATLAQALILVALLGFTGFVVVVPRLASGFVEGWDARPDGLVAVVGAAMTTTATLLANVPGAVLTSRRWYVRLNVLTILRVVGAQASAGLVYLATDSLGMALLACGLAAVGGLVLASVVALGVSEVRATARWLDRNEWLRVRSRLVEYAVQTGGNALILPSVQLGIARGMGLAEAGLFDLTRRVLWAGRQAVAAFLQPVFRVVAGDLGEDRLPRLRAWAAHVSRWSIALTLSALAVIWITAGPIARILTGDPSGLPDFLRSFGLAFAFSMPHIGLYLVLTSTPCGRWVNGLAGALQVVLILPSVLWPPAGIHRYAAWIGGAFATGSTLTFFLGFGRCLSQHGASAAPAASRRGGFVESEAVPPETPDL